MGESICNIMSENDLYPEYINNSYIIIKQRIHLKKQVKYLNRHFTERCMNDQ